MASRPVTIVCEEKNTEIISAPSDSSLHDVTTSEDCEAEVKLQKTYMRSTLYARATNSDVKFVIRDSSTNGRWILKEGHVSTLDNYVVTASMPFRFKCEGKPFVPSDLHGEFQLYVDGVPVARCTFTIAVDIPGVGRNNMLLVTIYDPQYKQEIDGFSHRGSLDDVSMTITKIST